MDEELLFIKMTDLTTQIGTLTTEIKDLKEHSSQDYSCRVDIKKELQKLGETVSVISATCVRKEDLNDIKGKIRDHNTFFKIMGIVLVIIAGALTGVVTHYLP